MARYSPKTPRNAFPDGRCKFSLRNRKRRSPRGCARQTDGSEPAAHRHAADGNHALHLRRRLERAGYRRRRGRPCAAPLSAWCAFFLSQNAAYDYRRFLDPRFRRCGLDCSGYLGWTLCAALHREPQNKGYVCPSTEMAGLLAARGLGTLLRSRQTFSPAMCSA